MLLALHETMKRFHGARDQSGIVCVLVGEVSHLPVCPAESKDAWGRRKGRRMIQPQNLAECEEHNSSSVTAGSEQVTGPTAAGISRAGLQALLRSEGTPDCTALLCALPVRPQVGFCTCAMSISLKPWRVHELLGV